MREPSTAEFLDALEACRTLGVDTSSAAFAGIARSALWKYERIPERSDEPGEA